MPAAVEKCVESILEKWRKHPEQAPKRNKDGKPIKGKDDLRSVAWAICTKAYQTGKLASCPPPYELQQEILQELQLARKRKGHGPALLGVALTTRPFIKRLSEAVLEETEESTTPLIRVPTLRKGKFRHPIYGILNFDDAFFEKIIHNWKKKVVGQDIPIKAWHKPDQPALAWVEKLYLNDQGELIAAGHAVDEDAAKFVGTKKCKYASAEFTLDYHDYEITLSFGADGLALTEVPEDYHEEDNMGDENLNLQEEGGTGDEAPDSVTISLEELEALRNAANQVKELDNRLTTAMSTIEQQASMITELQNQVVVTELEAAYERAVNFRDSRGYGHSAVFLNALHAALLMEGIVEEEGAEPVVELEDATSVDGVVDYYRKVLIYLAEHMPGVVPLEGVTEPGVPEEDEEETDENYGSDLWED